jgi:hypothetical protein
MVKRIDEAFALGRRKDVDVQSIVAGICMSAGAAVPSMKVKFYNIDMRYGIYFSVDEEIILVEAIRRPDIKKGLHLFV